jgi:hypothetical protein
MNVAITGHGDRSSPVAKRSSTRWASSDPVTSPNPTVPNQIDCRGWEGRDDAGRDHHQEQPARHQFRDRDVPRAVPLGKVQERLLRQALPRGAQGHQPLVRPDDR